MAGTYSMLSEKWKILLTYLIRLRLVVGQLDKKTKQPTKNPEVNRKAERMVK